MISTRLQHQQHPRIGCASAGSDVPGGPAVDSDDAGTEHVLDQAEDLTAAQRRRLVGAVACGGGPRCRLGGLPGLPVFAQPRSAS